MENDFYQFDMAKESAEEQYQSLVAFREAVLENGALPNKEKEIIAVALAHALGNSKQIGVHAKRAKTAGATLEELVESTFVAAALEAGGAITHSTHMLNALEENADDVLYHESNLKKLGNLRQLAPTGFNAYRNFSATAMKEGKLSAKLKELIAVAVAHKTECPYCIDVHTKLAQKAGATAEELTEAILVAALVCSSGIFANIDVLIEAYGNK